MTNRRRFHRLLYVAGLATCAFALVGSCSQGITSADDGPNEPRVVLNQDASSVLPPESGELAGRAVLQSTEENTVLVVGIDTASTDSKPDGKVDRIWALQAERPYASSFRETHDARISFAARRVEVRLATGGTVLLGLQDEHPLAPSTSVRGAVRRVTGFGLANRPGSWQLSSGFFDSETLARIVSTNCGPSRAGVSTQTIAPHCNVAGGPGSTSCSTSGCFTCQDNPRYCYFTQCTTSCSEGYYACCQCYQNTGALCGCVRNPR